jgi:hypothetical protein
VNAPRRKPRLGFEVRAWLELEPTTVLEHERMEAIESGRMKRETAMHWKAARGFIVGLGKDPLQLECCSSVRRARSLQIGDLGSNRPEECRPEFDAPHGKVLSMTVH